LFHLLDEKVGVISVARNLVSSVSKPGTRHGRSFSNRYYRLAVANWEMRSSTGHQQFGAFANGLDKLILGEVLKLVLRNCLQLLKDLSHGMDQNIAEMVHHCCLPILRIREFLITTQLIDPWESLIHSDVAQLQLD
jgi:hypothetical protein